MTTSAACPYCKEGEKLDKRYSYGDLGEFTCCRSCGVFFFTRRMTEEGQKAALASFAEKLDLSDYRRLVPENSRPELEWLETQLPATRGISVLDIGTSNGSFLKNLRQEWSVHAEGVEPLGPVAAVGREAGLTIHEGMFFDVLPKLSDASFDLVTVRESVYYLTDLARAFSEIRRVLKPGGWVYFKATTPESVWFFFNRHDSRYGPAVQGLATLKTMRAILRRSGFEPKAALKIPYQLHLRTSRDDRSLCSRAKRWLVFLLLGKLFGADKYLLLAQKRS